MNHIEAILKQSLEAGTTAAYNSIELAIKQAGEQRYAVKVSSLAKYVEDFIEKMGDFPNHTTLHIYCDSDYEEGEVSFRLYEKVGGNSQLTSVENFLSIHMGNKYSETYKEYKEFFTTVYAVLDTLLSKEIDNRTIPATYKLPLDHNAGEALRSYLYSPEMLRTYKYVMLDSQVKNQDNDSEQTKRPKI